LDGLLLQNEIKKLEKDLQEAVKGKKIGTGLVSLALDLLRALCLSTQLPVAGLIQGAYIQLIKKSPNHRVVFD
jgi:hypothetical protein